MDAVTNVFGLVRGLQAGSRPWTSLECRNQYVSPARVPVRYGKMYKAKDGNYEYNDAAKYIVLPHVVIHTHTIIIDIMKKIKILHTNHTFTPWKRYL